MLKYAPHIIWSTEADAYYTYIIGHYQPLVRITAKHLTPIMLGVLILYIREWSKVDCERQIFVKLFHDNFILHLEF